jgi:hypothetical protein
VGDGDEEAEPSPLAEPDVDGVEAFAAVHAASASAATTASDVAARALREGLGLTGDGSNLLGGGT